MKRTNDRSILTILALGLTVALAACSAATPTATSAPDMSTLPAATAPMQETTLPAATAMATTQAASTAAGGSCLVGTWKISDAVDLIISATSSLTQQGGPLTIGDISVSGDAQLSLNSDGTVTLTANNFNENFTATVSGQAYPITVTLQGQESGTYTTDGSNITFSGQPQATMQETITLLGNTTNVSDDLLDTSNITSSYPYSCPDNNTLNLQIADPSITTTPLVLARVN